MRKLYPITTEFYNSLLATRDKESIWSALGRELGFDPATRRPSGLHHFTAEEVTKNGKREHREEGV